MLNLIDKYEFRVIIRLNIKNELLSEILKRSKRNCFVIEDLKKTY